MNILKTMNEIREALKDNCKYVYIKRSNVEIPARVISVRRGHNEKLMEVKEINRIGYLYVNPSDIIYQQ